VLCLFCCQHGQENKDVEKMRKPPISNTSATHGEVTILALTRSSNIQKWKEYECLSAEDKLNFFIKNESAEVVNM